MGVHGHGQARPTVSDRLRAQGSLLVGREEELARAHHILTAENGPVVLHVHGPGGVGKSAYLHEIERMAQRLERPTCWVDADDLAGPHDLLASLGATGTAQLQDVLAPRTVVLLDHLEALALAQRWFWRELALALPADCTLVVAGRLPPQHLDPRLEDLVEVLPLRNLPAAAATRLLHARGIPHGVEVTRLVADTCGHPLALVIAADGWGALEDGTEVADTATLLHHPDPAARLLGRFVDDVDDPARRDALHVAAHVRRVDRAILRHALGVGSVEADLLLAWLRERPYTTARPDGLALHDVVRDVLDQDLRWRDPEAYHQMHTAVRTVLVRRLRDGPEASRARAAAEVLFLHRGNPATRALYDYQTLGTCGARPAGPQDRDVVLEAVARVEPHAGTTVARLLETTPGAVTVLEDRTGAAIGVGVIAALDDPALRAGDHVAESAWALLSRRREPAADERVLLQLMVDADHPRNLRTVTDVAAALSMAAWGAPDVGWVVLTTRHVDVWRPVWAYIGFEELGSVSLPDGSTVSVWARDFLRSPFETWLDHMGRQELDATGTLPAPVAAALPWSRGDFAEHVRSLLRVLHRPEQVAASPLARSELVRPDGASPAEQLREAVVEAVARTEEDPATERAARAVDRTYLRRAMTQEAAAEVLGMPFSTYRRHLALGVEAVVERLWTWEVHGGRRMGGD